MEIDDAIKGRRSIRKFQKAGISDEMLTELLDLARRAPSSLDGQPWHFILVRSEATKQQLAEIKNRYCPPGERDYRADFLQDAAAIVVVCVERGRSFDREIENGVLATATLLLAAHSRGLGGVFMTAYAAGTPKLVDEIRALLRIPVYVAPITLVPLGQPAETPGPKNLASLEKMIHFEKF